MLCPHAEIRTRMYGKGIVGSTHITVTSCQASAKTCPECDLLLRVVEEYKPGWSNAGHADGRLERVLHLESPYATPGVVRLREGSGGGWGWFNNLEVVGSFRFFRKAKGDILSLRGGGSQADTVLYESLEIVEASSSAAAIQRASKWLAHCVDHDKEECKILNPSFTPRRLLNVGTGEQNGEPFLFEPTVPTLYVCLSYCWGPDAADVLTTTKHNLQAHYQAVPLVAVPQTVRDTVTLCRGLKLENLWVDSLCIAQDDTQDWLQQSAEMRDIYANAHLTIAAEEPASCKLGFLGEQQFGKPGWQRVFTTHVPKEAGGPDNQLILRPVEEGETITSGRDERCSLDSRGWCLQESILPTRRLCFNGKEMSWECGRRRICECGHALWGITARPISYGNVGARIKQGYQKGRWDKCTPRDDWKEMVEDYSRRSLSKKTDKLSAISGLAKLFVGAPWEQKPYWYPGGGPLALPRTLALTVDNYKAGLWMNTFISDLAWWLVEPGSENSGPVPYSAPSWSWASVDGPVRFQYSEAAYSRDPTAIRRIDCTADDVRCETIVPSDHTGPLKAAYTVLTGPLVTAELVDHPPTPYYTGTGFPGEIPAHRLYVHGLQLYSAEVALDQPRDVFKDQAFFFFRLFTWKTQNGKRVMNKAWFLVLKRSSRDEAAFERIGVGVWLDPRESDLPSFDGAKPTSIKIV
ncbi:heterokaryon incompatibility protein-domain-containing protein [Chaetomium fimeti]|uniref:Heterokaryon incompatibility protein-domain-containing protein n=1 Tax=Chaetomium fimeti TaxID=1854472 RepID=A0AAE0HLD7_9PEZI|nr:heterokaryon incompatibility protein-domain-containing protein [Chaetomium fimeti]